MRLLAMIKRLLHPRHDEATPPPVALDLPAPPEHDPTYHDLANRLTAARARLRLLEHAAYARAEARSITDEMEDERHA